MADIITRAMNAACLIEYEHSREVAEVIREAVAEIERLRAALQKIADWPRVYETEAIAWAALDMQTEEPS